MSYRFLKITSVYPTFERRFLAACPGWRDATYSALLKRLVETRFALSDVHSFHLKSLGNYADEVFASIRALQLAWAREHGVRYGETTWLSDIVLAQIHHFKPDVLYLEDLYLFGAEFRKRVRDECGRSVVMVGWRAAPTPDFGVFGDLDLVVTASSVFADHFRAAGVRSEVIPHGFDTRVLPHLPNQAPDLDFTFVGSLGNRRGHHAERYRLIETLLRETPLQVWSDPGGPLSWRRFAAGLAFRGHRVLERFGIDDSLDRRIPALRRFASNTADPWEPQIWDVHPKAFNEPVFGLDAYVVLRRSRVTLNSHIDVAGPHAANMRLFEATGVGTCLLTDWKSNLHAYFEADTEAVTYRDANECSDKARYLLTHEVERERIAAAGQRRTLRDHTAAHRVACLDGVLKGLLADRLTATTPRRRMT